MSDNQGSDGNESAEEAEEIKALRQEILRLVLDELRTTPGMPIPVEIKSETLNALTSEVSDKIGSLATKMQTFAEARDQSLDAIIQRLGKIEKTLEELKRGLFPGAMKSDGRRQRTTTSMMAKYHGHVHEMHEGEAGAAAKAAGASDSTHADEEAPPAFWEGLLKPRWTHFFVVGALTVMWMIVSLMAGWWPFGREEPAEPQVPIETIYERGSPPVEEPPSPTSQNEATAANGVADAKQRASTANQEEEPEVEPTPPSEPKQKTPRN